MMDLNINKGKIIKYDPSNFPPFDQGGEDISTAVAITALPFTDTGNTCGALDDYDEACPLTSTSPDVVYSYAPTVDEYIDIDLCNSLYDTKVFVYENTSATAVGCDDDYYGFGDPCGSYVSAIFGLQVFAGNTYYYSC